MGTGQRAITVHGDGCTGVRGAAGMGRGQRAITVHGDSARVHGGAGSGCREWPESEGKWGPGQASVLPVHGKYFSEMGPGI